METLVPRLSYVWARARDLAGPVIVWAVWATLFASAITLIRQNTRNIPYMDDFAMVSRMTGQEPLSLHWTWAQHNEHRPVISRLILAGLFRFVSKDFRTGMYVNAGLMAVAAGSMVLLARKIRGHTSVTDAVLPLSILSLAQAETLLIGFALNLVLTAWITCALIATVHLASQCIDWRLALRFSLLMLLLPLCGGSGLVMVPLLALWLIAYVAWGCWSGREPGGAARAIGLVMLMGCSAIIALYLSDYHRPPHLPPAPSLAAAASMTVEVLSLVLCYDAPTYWWAAGLTVLLIVAATLLRLGLVAWRAPGERPRALGQAAIIVSMLAVAAAIGTSRSCLGAGSGLASRYVTIAAPLLSALYFAWLTYGPTPGRWVVHASLFTLVCLATPGNTAYALRLGAERRAIYLHVEQDLKARIPGSQVVARNCPALFPEQNRFYEGFARLKAARFGKVRYFIDDRAAAAAVAAPKTDAVVR